MDNFITIYNIKIENDPITARYSVYSGDLPKNTVAEVITRVGEHMTKTLINDFNEQKIFR